MQEAEKILKIKWHQSVMVFIPCHCDTPYLQHNMYKVSFGLRFCKCTLIKPLYISSTYGYEWISVIRHLSWQTDKQMAESLTAADDLSVNCYSSTGTVTAHWDWRLASKGCQSSDSQSRWHCQSTRHVKARQMSHIREQLKMGEKNAGSQKAIKTMALKQMSKN